MGENLKQELADVLVTLNKIKNNHEPFLPGVWKAIRLIEDEFSNIVEAEYDEVLKNYQAPCDEKGFIHLVKKDAI